MLFKENYWFHVIQYYNNYLWIKLSIFPGFSAQNLKLCIIHKNYI